MRGVGIRRHYRPSHKPNSALEENDAPVAVVFRVHTEQLSKAPFLFSPKNFNLSVAKLGNNKTTSATATAATASTTSTTAAATRASVNGAPAASSDVAKGARKDARAGGASGDDVGHLVECIVEVRPFVAATALTPGGGGGAAMATAAAVAAAASANTLPHASSYVELSLGLGATSHVDLFSLSSTISAVESAASASSPSAAATGATAGVAAATAAAAAAAPSGGNGTSLLHEHPSGGWICRLMCFNEREATHANGSISVSQALTARCPLINEVAKGRAVAQIIPTYAEVKQRYGLQHVELSCVHQYLSRSDLFMISETLRDRIVYAGEELAACGFRLRVNEILYATYKPCAGEESARSPASATANSVGSPSAAIPVTGASPTVQTPLRQDGSVAGSYQATALDGETSFTGGAGAAGATGSPTGSAAPRRQGCPTLVRVGCGVITAETHINFQSRSPVYYIVIELAREMWDTTMDGTVTVAWALKKFLREFLTREMPKRKVRPLLRIIFAGRLCEAYALRDGQRDVLHMLEVPMDARGVDVSHEAMLHCEAFVSRVQREVAERLHEVDQGPPVAAAELSPKDIFVLSKDTSTMEVLSIVLERCGLHSTDRRLNTTGHSVTIVSAGKGLYRVTNNLAQVNTARLHDVGLERVHIVCIGRPPLHATPLLEYRAADESLRSQYHLHTELQDPDQCFYESPPWISVLFYYPNLGAQAETEGRFSLLDKAEWLRRYQRTSRDGRGGGGGSAGAGGGLVAHFAEDPQETMAVPSAFINGQQVLLPGLGLPYMGGVRGVVYPADADPSLLLLAPPDQQQQQPDAIAGEAPAACTAHGATPTAAPSVPLPPRASGQGVSACVSTRWYYVHTTKTATVPERPYGSTTTSRPPQGAGGGGGSNSNGTMGTSPPEHICDDNKTADDALSWQRPLTATRADATPCGSNIVDSDIRNGYLVLELTLNDRAAPQAQWSPKLVLDKDTWLRFVSSFVGQDGRPHVADDGKGESSDVLFFQSSFLPTEVFCHTYSALTADGKTFILPTHSNLATFQVTERITFTIEPYMLVAGGEMPLRTSPDRPAPSSVSGEDPTPGTTAVTTVPLLQKAKEVDEEDEEDRGTEREEEEREGKEERRDKGGALSPNVGAAPAPAPPPPPQPSAPLLWRRDSGTTVTVGYIQLRSSILFALKPVDPLRGDEQASEELLQSQSSENISTSVVFRRRWLFKHPEANTEPHHIASWTRLCSCPMLPLYGARSAYPRDAFYSVSPHQYTIASGKSGEVKKRLSEFIIQRLQQQYQIVVEGASARSTYPVVWPRADPTANARVEMSAGHQHHTLKVGETLQTLSVTRMLHRGMYSNGQVMHMLSYSYLLWNYLDDSFATRRIHLEAQVGETKAFSWEELDRWVQARPDAFLPRGPSVSVRQREIALVLIPEEVARPPSFESFLKLINYRFSALLSTRGRVTWELDPRPVRVEVPPTFSPAVPESAAQALMYVVLSHDNPQALETRSVVDPQTGSTTAFEQPTEERFMTVDIGLPSHYNAGCCYMLKVSWLVCAACIVADWYGSFVATAGRYGFRAIPIHSDYYSTKTESLTVHWDVTVETAAEEVACRQRLLEALLTPEMSYYPDVVTLGRYCRLVHRSGLCYVVVLPNPRVVAQWYQNTLMQQGTPEQQALLQQFQQTVQAVKAGL